MLTLRQPSPARSAHARGFTLVEILIVVVILGVLAAIVIPQFANAAQDARKVGFAADIRIFAEAATVYMGKTGELLEDAGSGSVPTGFADYINEAKWLAGTPLGGVWDAQQAEMGITSGLGVHFNDGSNPGDTYMADIDGILDDGNLATGVFRKIAADRYYWVLLD